MISLSIVICTFERPALLGATLSSILALDGLHRARLDVVVVDNSDTSSAQAVVAGFAGARIPIRYLAAHPANISVARNAGLAATEADIVALVDDDQELVPGWLDAVLDGVAAHPHEVFFGPITPRFEDVALASAAARAMFTRAWDAPAGSALAAYGPGRPFAVSTANCILRRAVIARDPKPFDERLGVSGGEDLHLFCRLQRQGCRFAWLPGAGASDHVPRHRCAPDYLIARHYTGGQVFAAATIWTSPAPTRHRAVIAAKALVQLLLLPVAAIKAMRSPQTARLALSIKLASTWGKLFWFRLHPLYRDEAARYAAPGTAATS